MLRTSHLVLAGALLYTKTACAENSPKAPSYDFTTELSCAVHPTGQDGTVKWVLTPNPNILQISTNIDGLIKTWHSVKSEDGQLLAVSVLPDSVLPYSLEEVDSFEVLTLTNKTDNNLSFTLRTFTTKQAPFPPPAIVGTCEVIPAK